MPGAGFYPIGASRIVFGRDGRWYADGERITNPRIALLFSRHLVQRDDGTYALVMGDEKAAVEVEDTPWTVIGVDGDPARGFTITLNDRTTEALDPESIRIGSDNSFSCRVKRDARARFLRPAHNTLARHVEPADGAAGFTLRVRGRRYALAAGSPPR